MGVASSKRLSRRMSQTRAFRRTVGVRRGSSHCLLWLQSHKAILAILASRGPDCDATAETLHQVGRFLAGRGFRCLSCGNRARGNGVLRTYVENIMHLGPNARVLDLTLYLKRSPSKGRILIEAVKRTTTTGSQIRSP